MINNSVDKSFLQAIHSLKSQTERRVMNYLFFLSRKYKKVFPSQINMARKFKVSRATINRIISKLESLELIAIKRNFDSSCEYFVSSLFKKYKNTIEHVMWALHKFKIHQLIMSIRSSLLQNVTLSWKSSQKEEIYSESYHGYKGPVNGHSVSLKKEVHGRSKNHSRYGAGNRGSWSDKMGTDEIDWFLR